MLKSSGTSIRLQEKCRFAWLEGKATPSRLIIVIVIIVFGVFSNALFNGFVYDDIPQVVQNPWIREVRFIPDIFSTGVWAFQGTNTNYYRPLMHVSFMLSYYLFGLVPWGFHLVNILIHAGVTALIFLITSRLCREAFPSVPSFSLKLPFIAAVLFAVHPIHTEVVTWIGGVTDLLFTFFALLSLYLFILASESDRPQKGISYLSVVSFFLSTLCKEPALTLPLIFAAYDYAFPKRALRPLDYLKRYAPYLLAAAVYFILRFNALGGFAPVRRHGELSLFQYLINALLLFRQYLEKLILPVNLTAYHVFSPISSLSEWQGFLSLATAAAFLIALFALKKNGPFFFGLSLVLIPLLPVLYIPGVGENTFAERYLYLPSFGYVFLVAMVVGNVTLYRPRWTSTLIITLMVITCLYAVGTMRRNVVWKDDYRFWSDVVKKSPDSPVPHYNLGCILSAQGRIDEAVEEFQSAIHLHPAAVAYKSLGAAYQKKGLISEAIKQYSLAIQLQPDDAEAHTYLAAAYAELGALDKAIQQFLYVVEQHPNSADAHYNLGTAYLEKGLTTEAIPQLESAVRLSPSEPQFRSTLNEALSIKHRVREGSGRNDRKEDQ